MSTYRMLVQGEGVRDKGDWFGFYAARQTSARSEEAAISAVIDLVRSEWNGPSAFLGRLLNLEVVACWRPLFGWPSMPPAGHCFFNNDAEAQAAAFRIEARAARCPRAILKKLRCDLALR